MISNTFLNQLLPKIQQTKVLVRCQRFDDLFLFGLVCQYSTNQNSISAEKDPFVQVREQAEFLLLFYKISKALKS